MHHWLGGIAAALVIAFAASSIQAQAPGDSATPADPPDTEYRMGAQDPDPLVERRLPVAPPYKAFLPVAADLAGRMPPVGNQEGSSSSAAWAAAYAARTYYAAALEGRDVKEPANQPSPSYVYHLARQGGCDDGASFPRTVDVLRRGALSLADYPYKPDCAPPAPPELVATAQDFRVQGVHRVDSKRLDDVKGELFRGNPVIVELRVSPAFKRLRGEATFSEPDFDPGSKDNGRHFVSLIGYDDRRQAFRLINSWGIGWGDRGYAWLGYDAFRTHVSHAYVLDVVAPKRPKIASEPPGSARSPASPPAKPDLSYLDDLSCGRVRVETDGDRRVLTGFVASDADLKLVNLVATNVAGTTVKDVDVVPWPFCEALLSLEKALAAVDPPKIILAAKSELRAGDSLAFEVIAPEKPSFLYVSYVQADGSMVMLAQPKAPTDPSPPGTSLKFGDGKDGRPRFLISQPYGRELIIAIAVPGKPLAETFPARPAAREYLSALRRALIFTSADEDIGAAVKSLRTQAR